ncbi:multicopper oxidase [Melanomma pulvis-pyrius CBS 109.77]|uniref:laccase n=1 Tax=Melanomma pulvis-pyrius CBS 109.77 TaxID=1314802 RepID=A0A6A6XUJ3_9PLEO|nr:multicopper oxidase [Melanomma pulvis-pyrius CBS 109.77]
MTLIRNLLLLVAAVAAVPTPEAAPLTSRAVCAGNTAADRSVWCDYSIDTDYYAEVPDTGVTVEYWLEITNITIAPDGFERVVLAINGSVPGPTIEANWGDTLKIHVTNRLTANGTGIHWHGIRQNYTVQNDGVPSITQCPVAPEETLTYTWRATQYGSSWYHSHWALQAWEGVAGSMVIHGPATANYDEELDSIFLSDWSHETVDALYPAAERGGPPLMDTGLINGKNVWNGGGSRYEKTIESGKKYRIRVVNGAIDTFFKFSIDNHPFTVIAMDFVPIVPFETNVLDITMGQRYDIIIEANQDVGDYWMRAIPQLTCSSNADPDNIRAIIRYSSSSTADPVSTAWDQTDSCNDAPLSDLVPHLSQTVIDPTTDDSDMTVSVFASGTVFKWKIGIDSMLVKWAEPSLLQINEGNATFESEEAVYELPNANQWVYFVIETQIPVPHPIHLHGHDFFVLAAAESATYDDSVALNLVNPPRRDVATLPSAGYLVISFFTDNPGAWLMHCHIGWHTSEGLALQFVERESEIPALLDADTMNSNCATWNAWTAISGVEEEDSGV